LALSAVASRCSSTASWRQRAAHGSADLEHDVPIASDTIFEAGAVSKQFTAAAVVLLARAHALAGRSGSQVRHRVA
jgi:hypothetical protein